MAHIDMRRWPAPSSPLSQLRLGTSDVGKHPPAGNGLGAVPVQLNVTAPCIEIVRRLRR